VYEDAFVVTVRHVAKSDENIIEEKGVPEMETVVNFDLKKGICCLGKDNAEKAGKLGNYFGTLKLADGFWAIVVWQGEEKPVLYDANFLLVEDKTWKSLT
jgi:hypothetical protein